MGRCAQQGIGAIQFQPGSTPADQAEIADQLVPAHALEDEGGARIETAGLAPVIGRDIEALGGEADARQDLRRPAVAAPEPAITAVEALVILAGLRGPGADAAFAAADLDHAG
jgi:hypothetical protein